jgi:hypothetical protein
MSIDPGNLELEHVQKEMQLLNQEPWCHETRVALEFHPRQDLGWN